MTVFSPEPHNNFGIILDWCHHPHSTDKAGRNHDCKITRPDFILVFASQYGQFLELTKQVFTG